jgi:hypothetical protein
MRMERADALLVGRPPGVLPGWTVWHVPSGLQAIIAVRYKADAEQAHEELLLTAIDWAKPIPVREDSPYWATYARIYRRYADLRHRQLGDNPNWPRPKERTPNPAPGSLARGEVWSRTAKNRKQTEITR